MVFCSFQKTNVTVIILEMNYGLTWILVHEKIKQLFNGKLGVMRVVTSPKGFTRAFSIRVFYNKKCCSNCHLTSDYEGTSKGY